MTGQEELKVLIEKHLDSLVTQIGSRPVGSANNKKAQAYVADTFSACGLEVREQPYACLDWEFSTCGLWCADSTLSVKANPFTPPCDLTAATVAVGTVEELEESVLEGKIVVIYNGLTQLPLSPHKPEAINPKASARVLELLVEKNPLAVIAVATNSQNHSPAIEDGTFPLPSVTIPQDAGKLLLAFRDQAVSLKIDSSVQKSEAANIIASTPSASGKKMVVCAHLDTKHNSPGALDNASGLAALLALAQVRFAPKVGVEFVALNGEEYDSFRGLRSYGMEYKDWEETIGMINLDGIGAKGEKTAVAGYGCSPQILTEVDKTLAKHPELVQVEPWDQANCKFFAQRGVPGFALRSYATGNLIDSVIHTAADELYLLSPGNIAATVEFIGDCWQAFLK